MRPPTTVELQSMISKVNIYQLEEVLKTANGLRLSKKRGYKLVRRNAHQMASSAVNDTAMRIGHI